MKITYLHQYFNTPDMSGGTRSYEMARRMVAAGHEVNMITSRGDDMLPAGRWTKQTIDGIHVHWLPVPYTNAMGYARRLLAFTQFARRASGYAAAIDADVVFATSTPLTIAIPGVRASRRRHAPMVFEVRDLWPELPLAMGALRYPLAGPIARQLERWAYTNSAHIVGLSPGMCEGVARTGYPADRIHCIPNSCDIALFDVPDEQGHAFRARRAWLGDRPLVVYAGTFGRINGVGYLADLAKEVLQDNPEVRFLAVGQGAEVEMVREKARAMGILGVNFFMEDAVPKFEIPALLSAATLCISLFIPLPAMWHNSANKFFDALAAGRPIAINYGGWQSRLLANSGAGIELHHADMRAAARQLDRFIKDPSALASARKASIELARTHFSRDGLARDLVKVLESAVNDRPPEVKLSEATETSMLAASGRWNLG